jgi:hypothetical protein
MLQKSSFPLVYVTELYDRPNRPETLEVEPEEEVDIDEKGPYILQSEVEKAVKEIRHRKATGDDDVPGVVLKLLGEGGLKILTKPINTIYETGEWPKNFTEVTMIAFTYQRGVTSAARNSENTCHGVTSTACHAALSHSFDYILTTGRKCNRADLYVFMKELALLLCGFLQIIASFFSLLSKFGFPFCSL